MRICAEASVASDARMKLLGREKPSAAEALAGCKGLSMLSMLGH